MSVFAPAYFQVLFPVFKFKIVRGQNTFDPDFIFECIYISVNL